MTLAVFHYNSNILNNRSLKGSEIKFTAFRRINLCVV